MTDTLKKLLCSSAFMMGLALVVSLLTYFSGVFPDEVLTQGIRTKLTIIGLAVMMTLSLSRIPAKKLSPAYRPKDLRRGVLLGMVLAAAVPLLGYFLMKDAWPGYAEGLVFIAAAPFAASVAPLSFILRGDAEHAARTTIYTYIIALAWIPAVIWLILGETVDMRLLVLTVVTIIGIPLVISRLLTGVKIQPTTMAIVLNCTIFFLVWLSVSTANFKDTDAAMLIAFLAIAALRTFGLGTVLNAVEQRQGIAWTQRVTDVLMVSYRNKGIALALCAATLAGPLIPLAMVAIATSIVVEVSWVVCMDSVLFSRKRMEAAKVREQNLT
jgi:BASS family bile acid:Na+ symporter